MGDAATPALPDFTSQTASVYKANIDAGFAVAWPRFATSAACTAPARCPVVLTIAVIYNFP